MPDMTRDFMNHPANFLAHIPLIVSLSPDSDFGPDPARFVITTSDTLHNSVRSAIPNAPCEITEDRHGQSPLTAYWCPYIPDAASRRLIGNRANFMFTANMDGCTFATDGSGGTGHVASHSNAATIAARIRANHRLSVMEATLLQKAMQIHLALKVVGRESPIVEHSLSGNCTTVAGVRDITTGTWAFYKQVIGVSEQGVAVTVKSLIRF
jgi:hypothetical protein